MSRIAALYVDRRGPYYRIPDVDPWDLRRNALPYDDHGGFTIDVDQVSWGHVARKRTRLYFVGVSRQYVMSLIRFGGTASKYVMSGPRCKYELPICTRLERRLTPIPFALFLVSMARTADPWQ